MTAEQTNRWLAECDRANYGFGDATPQDPFIRIWTPASTSNAHNECVHGHAMAGIRYVGGHGIATSTECPICVCIDANIYQLFGVAVCQQIWNDPYESVMLCAFDSRVYVHPIQQQLNSIVKLKNECIDATRLAFNASGIKDRLLPELVNICRDYLLQPRIVFRPLVGPNTIVADEIKSGRKVLHVDIWYMVRWWPNNTPAVKQAINQHNQRIAMDSSPNVTRLFTVNGSMATPNKKNIELDRNNLSVPGTGMLDWYAFIDSIKDVAC
jgi:hypothetical protein